MPNMLLAREINHFFLFGMFGLNPKSGAILFWLGYLIGSVPFGYLIVRLSGRGDVRETGSGGTGATNVMRRAGRWAGTLTLVLDGLKGVVAVLLARRLSAGFIDGEQMAAIAACGAVVGHCFPVWLGFRGGKGVATALGVFLVLAPFAVICAACVFVPVVWLTRYVSLGSILAALTVPLCVWFFPERTGRMISHEILLVTSVCIGGLVIFMHRANIKRLVQGAERKL